MSREIKIKFRAWDKKNKSFILDDNEFKEYMIGLDGKFYRMDFYSGVSGYEDGNLIWNELEDIVLMQYTGLLDKNGIKIFEGDVVNVCFNGSYGKDCWTAVVEWCKINPSFFLKKVNPPCYSRDEYDFVKCELLELLVIGNIYEHKYLINNK